MTQMISERGTCFPFKPATLPTKTRGEIEAAICEEIIRFQQEYIGRGPNGIRTYLIADLLVVRLKGALTLSEQRLVKSLPDGKGRELLKQIRTQLFEAARPEIEASIEKVLAVKIVSLHHDIIAVTGEEVMLFTLAESPQYREPKNR